MVRLAVAFSCVLICGRAADDKGAAETKPLPSAKQILERFAKAIGGKEVFMQSKSQHARGTVQMPAQGVNGTLNVYAARPNKLLMKMTIKGVGEFNTGFDGQTAWMSSALTGPMLLEGKMRDEIATQADFDHALHDPADYKSMEVLGAENFNGEECYQLKLVHRTGFASTEYFSIKTGLQRGFTATQESPLGPVTATTVVTDYKQFGPLLMPSRTSQKAAGVETIMTMDEMEFDQVNPAVFELPAEVKALLETPEAPAKESGNKAIAEPAAPRPSPAAPVLTRPKEKKAQ